MTRDPIFHAGITDKLPDNHPRAWDTIKCEDCSKVVHSIPNETMDLWFETGRGAYCFECFVSLVRKLDSGMYLEEHGLGLPD